MGSDRAPLKCREAMTEFQSFELTNELLDGQTVILDLGDVITLNQEVALNELYNYVGEIYYQCPNAIVIVVGGMRE